MPGPISGQDDDVLNFAGTTWGSNPAGTFTLGLDGNLYSLNPEHTDALEILP